MARRRPSFRTYVRRRWRAVGLLLVLFAGSLLVLLVTDRGHDPLWEARSGPVDQAAVSPDGSAVYSLVRTNGNITRLEAREGASGRLLWQSSLNATRALMRAADDGVAVANDFPFAFLTYYASDGSIRFQLALEGNPRAMAAEGGRLALALQAPGNPVLVYEAGKLVRTHRFGTFVDAIDLRSGILAAGTGDGEVGVWLPNGTRVLNLSFPFTVKSLHLSRDGTALALGGFSLTPGNLSGAVAFVDLAAGAPLRWTYPTALGVSYVAIDDAGVYAMAVEDTPPRYHVRVFDTATGTARWTHEVPGYVAADDAGATGGAALAPDGSLAVVGTLDGGMRAANVADGSPAWEFSGDGTTQVLFARDRPDLLVANGRLTPNGPLEGTVLFSTRVEPFLGRLPAMTATIAALTLGAGAVVVGGGYWLVRRST